MTRIPRKYNTVKFERSIYQEAKPQREQGHKKKLKPQSSRPYDPSVATLLASLKSCSRTKDLEQGTKLHHAVTAAGHDSNLHVATALVDMYSNCGSPSDAKKVFDAMPNRDVVTWNALILGYVENGQTNAALELFVSMHKTETYAPNARTYVAVLMAYTSLARKQSSSQVDRRPVKTEALHNGLRIYSQAKAQAQVNVYVATAMVDLCSNCSSMSHARAVFDSVRHPDVGLYNALILGYVENGESEVALELFTCMKLVQPDSRTYLAAFMACGELAEREDPVQVDGKAVKAKSLQAGINLHAQAERRGYETDVFVANCLINMYSKCGEMVLSRRVFERMTQKTVISWTALVQGYVDNDHAELALQVFSRMSSEGCQPDDRALSAALTACADLAHRETGTEVDGKRFKLSSLEKTLEIHSRVSDGTHILTGTSLVEAYARSGSMQDATMVFTTMVNHDVVVWNALLTGYAESSQSELCLELYDCMQAEGCAPLPATCAILLSACIRLAEEERGTEVDGRYFKLKSMEKAMSLHVQAERSTWLSDIYVSSTLVDVYSRCGSLADAWRVFNDCMPLHNVITWTVLLFGYVDNGEPELALELFGHMKELEFAPRAQTLAVVLKACSATLDLRAGKALHGEVCRFGFSGDEVLDTSLMEVYGRCGSLVNTQLVFESVSSRDFVTWNSLISSYSQHGQVDRVFEVFDQMQEEQFQANAGTFVALLAACSHAGLVEKGRNVFDGMQRRYGVEARVEHYNCMVDMLGRANELEEAVEMVKKMPFEASALTWRTLLGASQTWKNDSVGKLAFDSLVKLDEKGPAAYVLMANIYGSS